MMLSYVHGASSVALLSDSIGAALDRAASLHERQCAVVSRHQRMRLTYGELRVEVERAARGLMALGVEPGDRVGIWSTNCVEWLIAQYAVVKIGAVLVTLNPAYREGDLAHALDQSGARVLIAATRSQSADVRAILTTLLPELGRSERLECARLPALRHLVCVLGDAIPGSLSWRELCDGGDIVPETVLRTRAAAVEFDDPANIMYTSGTTGAPRGATLSHHSLLNSGSCAAERLRYSAGDRICLPVPLSHTLGCVVGALAAVTRASTLVLPDEIFDVRGCLDAIEEERCTAIYGVPAMFSAMLKHPAFARARVESLRTGVMAGAPCPIALVREVTDTMHMPEVTICYGMTEAGTLAQSLPDDPLDRRAETVGAIHPHVECKIVDPATGRIVPRGVAGELHARGYCLMSEFWNDAEATRQTLGRGGWLRTGDLALMRDDGYLCIVGRIKDIIISGGRNVHPGEIENVLRTHPAVQEVAVTGVPDDLYGEAPCAWIQLRDGETPTADEIRRFCRERLPVYKVPRRVRFIDRLPLTASGKVQKFRLREQLPVASL